MDWTVPVEFIDFFYTLKEGYNETFFYYDITGVSYDSITALLNTEFYSMIPCGCCDANLLITQVSDNILLLTMFCYKN